MLAVAVGQGSVADADFVVALADDLDHQIVTRQRNSVSFAVVSSSTGYDRLGGVVDQAMITVCVAPLKILAGNKPLGMGHCGRPM